MFDLIAEIRQTLRNNKLRTWLTGFSVSWGVFMLILLLGVARGVSNNFQQQSQERADNIIEVHGGRTSVAYRGYREGRAIELRNTDRSAIEQEVHQTVEAVYASASNDTAVVVGPYGTVTGLDAVYPETMERNIQMVKGRAINDRDIDECRRVVLLAERNARLLFGSADDAVGKTVSSMGLAWTVVGIYSHEWSTSTMIPYTTLKMLTGNTPDVSSLKVFVKDINTEEQSDRTEQQLRQTLAHMHDFDPADRNAVWIWNSISMYIKVNGFMIILNLAMWIIGLLTLVTGVVGVSNIMFVSVRERTKEIGIRRAIGAKPRSILTQILAEGVTITALFGYLGVFLGMLVLQIVDAMFSSSNFISNPTVDISIALQVTCALIVAGALAGLFPALKALKIKPVEALSDE